MKPIENATPVENATPAPDMYNQENKNRLIIGLKIGDTNTFAVVQNNIETEIDVLGAGA